MLKENQKIAIVKEYYGGNWARTRVEKCIIIPKYFKNGNLIKSKFQTVEVLEVIEKGYCPKNANVSRVIDKIIEE